jgi:hypothetical protein
MRKRISGLILLAGFVFILSLVNGCYYDNAAYLYPNVICDTTKVSFAQTIQPILQNNCYTCHSGSTPVGGLVLTDYTSVMTVVENGQLKGSVTGVGYPLMPLTGKLDNCSISQIVSWINAGAPNN